MSTTETLDLATLSPADVAALAGTTLEAVQESIPEDEYREALYDTRAYGDRQAAEIDRAVEAGDALALVNAGVRLQLAIAAVELQFALAGLDLGDTE